MFIQSGHFKIYFCICRIRNIDSKQRVELEDEKRKAMQRKVPYCQIKPMKTSDLHSSTDTSMPDQGTKKRLMVEDSSHMKIDSETEVTAISEGSAQQPTLRNTTIEGENDLLKCKIHFLCYVSGYMFDEIQLIC